MTSPNEIRVVKNRDAWRRQGWSATPNSLLLRSDISWDAKGAFGWLSLAADDPEFDVTAQALAAAGPRGRDHARGMVRELEQHGYLTRERSITEDGAPVMVYELWPQPVPEDQRTYRPSTARSPKRMFSQVKPQELDGQALGADQVNVDNSEPSDEAPTEHSDVFAGQAPKTGRSGPGRSGPGRLGVLTTSPERTPSSSVGSSFIAAGQARHEEEEEDHNQAKNPQTEDRFRAEAEALLEEVRFKPGRYLRRQARRQVIELIALRLSDGHTVQALRAYLRTWAAEALNPSVYLAERLDCLPASPPQLGLVEDLIPDWCGQCDPEGRDKPKLRKVEGEDGEIRRCPRCHPQAVNTPKEQTA